MHKSVNNGIIHPIVIELSKHTNPNKKLIFFRLIGTPLTGASTADSTSQGTEMSDYQQTSISLLRAQLKVTDNVSFTGPFKRIFRAIKRLA